MSDRRVLRPKKRIDYNNLNSKIEYTYVHTPKQRLPRKSKFERPLRSKKVVSYLETSCSSVDDVDHDNKSKNYGSQKRKKESYTSTLALKIRLLATANDDENDYTAERQRTMTERLKVLKNLGIDDNKNSLKSTNVASTKKFSVASASPDMPVIKNDDDYDEENGVKNYHKDIIYCDEGNIGHLKSTSVDVGKETQVKKTNMTLAFDEDDENDHALERKKRISDPLGVLKDLDFNEIK